MGTAFPCNYDDHYLRKVKAINDLKELNKLIFKFSVGSAVLFVTFACFTSKFSDDSAVLFVTSKCFNVSYSCKGHNFGNYYYVNIIN